MLISKFDIYKSEWLELVFDDRNKSYGAYELRQHYPKTMLKAMAIAFLSIVTIAFVTGVLIRPIVTPVPNVHLTVVPLINVVYPPVVKPPKQINHPHVATPPPASATRVNTHIFVPPVITIDRVAATPPAIKDLSKGAIGPIDIKTPGNGSGSGNGKSTEGEGVNTSTLPGTDVYPPMGLERMPEPYGGDAAWAKFLKKNLTYPDMAVDEHMQGRVLVSFIIEKDGHLSNFVIERSMGYGMDEEALRVLKRAPAWKPGMQNGQPVRVKYTIPINFQMQE